LKMDWRKMSKEKRDQKEEERGGATVWGFCGLPLTEDVSGVGKRGGGGFSEERIQRKGSGRGEMVKREEREKNRHFRLPGFVLFVKG